ncbi:MAG: autotransporter outer membrane beta-barrel domain-containing protein [Rhizomicrobium sp.]
MAAPAAATSFGNGDYTATQTLGSGETGTLLASGHIVPTSSNPATDGVDVTTGAVVVTLSNAGTIQGGDNNSATSLSSGGIGINITGNGSGGFSFSNSAYILGGSGANVSSGTGGSGGVAVRLFNTTASSAADVFQSSGGIVGGFGGAAPGGGIGGNGGSGASGLITGSGNYAINLTAGGITGGFGAAGATAFLSSGGGGFGGAGGDAVELASSHVVFSNSGASLFGGGGGAGADSAGVGYAAGNGGAGGIGLLSAGASLALDGGAVSGGAGGNGGNVSIAGCSGGGCPSGTGGAGGFGMLLLGGVVSTVSIGTDSTVAYVHGGNGGNGGNHFAAAFGNNDAPSLGGAAGDGISVQIPHQSLHIFNGVIVGGNAGNGGTTAETTGSGAAALSGGVGLSINAVAGIVLNAGSVVGGVGGAPGYSTQTGAALSGGTGGVGIMDFSAGTTLDFSGTTSIIGGDGGTGGRGGFTGNYDGGVGGTGGIGLNIADNAVFASFTSGTNNITGGTGGGGGDPQIFAGNTGGAGGTGGSAVVFGAGSYGAVSFGAGTIQGGKGGIAGGASTGTSGPAQGGAGGVGFLSSATFTDISFGGAVRGGAGGAGVVRSSGVPPGAGGAGGDGGFAAIEIDGSVSGTLTLAGGAGGRGGDGSTNKAGIFDGVDGSNGGDGGNGGLGLYANGVGAIAVNGPFDGGAGGDGGNLATGFTGAGGAGGDGGDAIDVNASGAGGTVLTIAGSVSGGAGGRGGNGVTGGTAGRGGSGGKAIRLSASDVALTVNAGVTVAGGAAGASGTGGTAAATTQTAGEGVVFENDGAGYSLLNNGTIKVGNAASGTAALAAVDAAAVATHTLVITNNGTISGGTNSVLANGGGAVTLTLGSASTTTGGVLLGAGNDNVTLFGGAAFGAIAAAGGSNTFTLRGTVTGTFDWTKFTGVTSIAKQDAGTWIVTGTDPGHAGGTTISGGTLEIGDGVTASSLAGGVAAISGGATLALAAGASVTASEIIVGDGTTAGTLLFSGSANDTSWTRMLGGTIRSAITGAPTGQITFAHGIDTVLAASGTTLTLGSTSAIVWGEGDGATVKFGSATDTGTVVVAGVGGGVDQNTSIEVSGGVLRAGNGLLLQQAAHAPSVTVDVGATFDANDKGLGVTQGINNLLGAGSVITGSNSASRLGLHNADFSGIISGAGHVDTTLVGPLGYADGAVILSGTNTYSGGTTIGFSAGFLSTLQLGNGGTSGSILGNVANDGLLIFERSNSYVFAGAISGIGAVRQAGTGTTILTGANTYAGGTVVTDGVLQIGDGGTAGSIVGDVVDSGLVVFERSNSITFSGAISGAGAVTQAGSGTTTLSGVSTYTGTTSVNSGTLAVDGSIASPVSVNAGGTLGGTGTVGSTTVQSGGVLAPGNPVGTLHVGGTLTLASGSTTVVEVDPASSDKIVATGAVSIAGQLFVNFAAGTYTAGQYTVISTTGALSGSFSSFDSLGLPHGFIETVTYDAHSAFLNLIVADFIWSATPGSSDWNAAGNWKYGVVPSATDTAKFETASVSTIDIHQATSIASLQFDTATPTYTFNIVGSAGGAASLTVGGLGIVDAPSNAPLFNVSGVAGSGGTLTFANAATAGDAKITAGAFGSVVFDGKSDAGSSAHLIAASGGTVDFSGTAGSANDGNVSAGSIAGAGSFKLGGDRLSVGANNASTEVSGVIADGGAAGGSGASLVKVGSGTLTLSGANTYTGGTTVSAGTLQLGSGGTSGSILGNVTDNATLAFNRSDAVSFGGVISGSGAVIQAGTGTTTFTATNTYGGGTMISAGALQIGAGGTAGAIAGDVVDNAQLIFNRSDAATFGGTISGTGGVLLAGGGITTFTAVSTYGGGTTISAGALQLDTGGDIAGNVVDNATLIFNRSGTNAFGGVISGTGALTHSRGTLILTAANTYSGTTTIAAGATLQLGNGGASGSIAGDVIDNATLIFNRTDTITFAGVISGTGGLAHNGTGTTILTAIDTYSGPTVVNAGVLDVNGSIANSAVTTNGGGSVKGNGTLGSISLAPGGHVAPGNSIGTLTVAGNIAFVAGSTYDVEADAAGAADRINAGGIATISGGTIAVAAAPGVYTGLTYRILSAAGGVNGAFAGLTTNSPSLIARLFYGPTTVDLFLVSDIDFAPLTHTPNEIAAAAAIKAGGASSALYNAFLTQQPATAFIPGALDQLSGTLHADLRSAMFEDNRAVRQALLRRLRQATSGGPDSRDVADGVTAWLHVLSNWGSVDGDGNAATLDQANSGILGGIDTRLTDDLRVGLAGGYTHSHVSTDANSANATSGNGHVAGYAGWSDGSLKLRLAVAYGWGDAEVVRVVQFPGFSNILTGKQSEHTTQAVAEIGDAIDGGWFAFEPFAGVNWVEVGTGGFAETGGAAALSGNGGVSAETYTSLGLRFSGAPAAGDLLGITPNIALAWEHAFGTPRPRDTVAVIATSQSFATLGVPLGGDALTIQAGIDIQITARGRVGLGYDGVLSGNARNNAVRADLSWDF